MKMYILKLRRYKRGAYGTTRYRFALGSFARPFAVGYAAALHDIGITDLYVSLADQDGNKLLDAPEVQQILERMVIR